MTDLPPEPGNLRFLRLLVTTLTATMILGIAAIVVLLFIRFQTAGPALPDTIALPTGVTAVGFTSGPGWYGVVTDTGTILIFDQDSGALRQTIAVTSD